MNGWAKHYVPNPVFQHYDVIQALEHGGVSVLIGDCFARIDGWKVNSVGNRNTVCEVKLNRKWFRAPWLMSMVLKHGSQETHLSLGWSVVRDGLRSHQGNVQD